VTGIRNSIILDGIVIILNEVKARVML